MTRNIYIKELDTTDITKWEEKVTLPACEVCFVEQSEKEQIVQELLETPFNLNLNNSQKWIEKETKYMFVYMP